MESLLSDFSTRSSLSPVSEFASWNNTAPLKNIPIDSNLAWLLCALCLAMSWVIYITYYNSRVIGFILTKILNHFIKDGCLKIGSISVSVLSGKIMFRDVAYITEDCSWRAQDGWLIFRWWYPFVKRDISEDCSHSDARLSVLLNGFELHVYNRSKLYSKLECLFELEKTIIPSGNEQSWQDSGGESDTHLSVEETPQMEDYKWRELTPVIKTEISTGRLVFGNRLLPTTLSVNFEEAHFMYTTKPASSSLDYFTHILKCKAENFKVILAPSPKYTGLSDEPPRYMGEGFVVFQSNFVDFYYYQDVAGIVSSEPEVIELADGDTVERSTTPLWGLDIKCGKGTDFSYGPWADRQREHLYKFFFPQDYQTLKPTEDPKVGEQRLCQSFDIRLSTLAEATVDILFSKEKETNAVHMNIGPGSYLEMTIPWTVSNDGYSTDISGQLLHLEASTSLQYRSLVESETLQFSVQVKYPSIWNDHQLWHCSLTGCKATVHLIYAHKYFFHALMEDWVSKSRPDVIHFVPYTWHFSIILKEFEVITLTNEYNWIDCSSQHQENSYIALSGEHFEFCFDLPFNEYLPSTVSVNFWMQGESIDMCMHLPEMNSSADLIYLIEKCSKLSSRDGSPFIKSDNKKWRNMSEARDDWVDCWSVPVVALSIVYIYHPAPLYANSNLDLDITTPEKEEILLSPIRPNGLLNPREKILSPNQEFDPTSLAADVVRVEVEFGPSVIKLYGSLLRMLINLKENYLGEHQKYHEFNAPVLTASDVKLRKNYNSREFDPRAFRPLEVIVSLTMHDIHGHIMKCCNDGDPPCPSLFLEQLAFEMHKTYDETILQLLLSPLMLSSTDAIERPENDKHLKDGYLILSSLQVRGHAMFSGTDRPLDSETLEYAWLIEILIGEVTGRITVPQMYNAVSGFELFVFQVQQPDSELQPPHAFKFCLHDLPQSLCPYSIGSVVCPNSEEIKYRMIRISVDVIELCVVESGCAMEIEVFPLRLSTCNLHGTNDMSGLSLLLQNVKLRQYSKISSNLLCSSIYSLVSHGQNSHHGSCCEMWLEVGNIGLGPIYMDAVFSLLKKDSAAMQTKYLKTHDAKRKQLWFLWSDDVFMPHPIQGRCGCAGGCAFFGNNKNGPSFFSVNSSDKDFVTSKYELRSDGNPGFGESILHKGHFVFQMNRSQNMVCWGHSSSHSEKTFNVSDTSCLLNACKIPESVSKSVFSQYGYKSQSFVSESFLNEKFCPHCLKKNIVMEESTCSDIHSFSWESGQYQVRSLKRQLSNPTHMSVPHYSSVLMSHLPKTGQPVPVPQKNERKHFFKSDDLKSNLDGTFVNISHAKECCLSSCLSQKRNSHASLNAFLSSRGENNGSRHSLAGNVGRCYSPRSIRRATSMESTQSSDSYISADEDVSNDTLSDHGPADEEKPTVIQNAQNSYDRISAARRSLHDIQETPSQISSDSDAHETVLQRAQCSGHPDPSDSNSASSTSFISAVSSQEDIALVDLHNQMDKPIMESPLLMSCYLSHMTQLSCQNWFKPPPLPHLLQYSSNLQAEALKEGSQPHANLSWKTKFIPITDGFTSIHMTEKNKLPYYCQNVKPAPKQSTDLINDHSFLPGSFYQDSKTDDFNEETASKDVFVIKFAGDVHLNFSPLLIESLKSFIDVLIPTLSNLHPVAVVNQLHLSCSSEVQKHNQLKKEKVLHLSQLKAQMTKNKNNLRNPSGQHQGDDSFNKFGDSFKETRACHTRVTVRLSKINISVMQASLVEEVIAFSALDNLRDLTCVSLFCICVDDTVIQLSNCNQIKKVIQTFSDCYPESLTRSKVEDSSTKKSKTDSLPTELLSLEKSESQQEETVLSACIAHIHCQLRRLKNNSSILKDALLTIIPFHKSKVEFTFETFICSSKQKGKHFEMQDSVVDSGWNLCNEEEKMGFIMFECGLDQISLKFMKQCGFDSSLLNNDEKHQLPAAESKSIYPKKDFFTLHGKASKLLDQPQQSEASLKSNPQEVPCYTSEKPNHNYPEKANPNQEKLQCPKGTASFFIEIKTVWFNFAAPPRTPNTRKIDFTRLDWHLLSTATPSINAWLKPSDRFILSIKEIVKESNHRIAASLACMMAEALEVENIHMPIKSKYMTYKLSPLAKTLQEDPSCQLLIVLRRYLKNVHLESFEANLLPGCVPPPKVLFHGLIALSRQWKNVLYMPFLLEQNIRYRKTLQPLNLSLSSPHLDAVLSSHNDAERMSIDECEVTDETTNLLLAEGGSLTVGNGMQELQGAVDQCFSNSDAGSLSTGSSHDVTEEMVSSGSVQAKSKKKLPSYPPRTSRASVAFPLLGGPLDSPERYAGLMSAKSNAFHPCRGISISGLKRNESKQSFKSTTWSLTSDPNFPTSVLGTPHKSCLNGDAEQLNEDLYNWMARQQEYVKITNYQKRSEQKGFESKKSASSKNAFDNVFNKSVVSMLNFAPLTIQLADAHIIFQPLFKCIRFSNHSQDSSFSNIFGSKVSTSCSIELVKIDIVESEYQNHKHKKRKSNHKQSDMLGKFFIDTSMDTPTFICDKLLMEFELREVHNDESYNFCYETLATLPAFILMPNSSVYSMVLNFSIDINFIAIQVNMPLLRLLHQFSTMYENIKETRLELKANRPNLFKESNKDAKKKFSPPDSHTEIYQTHTVGIDPASPVATKSSSVGVFSVPSGIRKPQNLSHRLRASTKGYSNLQEMTSKDDCCSSPESFALSESVVIDGPEETAKPVFEPADDHPQASKDLDPRCWRTMCYLLDLYNTMPEPKTVSEKASSMHCQPEKKSDVFGEYKGNGKYEPLKEQVAAGPFPDDASHDKPMPSAMTSEHMKNLTKALMIRDWIPLIIFGVANVHKTKLLAMLSGLKLESELNGFHCSLTHREKVCGAIHKSSESSLSGQLVHAMITVLEGIPPSQQTVVKVTVGKSQAFYSCQDVKKKERNSALITIGPVNIDIPQHPVVLHGMMTRSSRQISTTLQELRATRQPLRTSRPMEENSSFSNKSPQQLLDTQSPTKFPNSGRELIRPFNIQFNVVLDSLTIGAAVLPSLRAQYQMGQVISMGVTGSKVKFTVDLPNHTLSFNTKVQPSEGNLPSSASVDLPLVHISAEYIQDPASTNVFNPKSESFTDGVVLCQGSYLSALAEIGSFEHSLTTDLLNHLVLVQKVFMKEVNEVVQKMSGADKPVPIWGEQDKAAHMRIRSLLYSLLLRLKGIQITATTPTSSAVRLETGMVELQLSNRVQNMSSSCSYSDSYLKLFGKAQVDVNLALGQLIKNAVFEEAELDFQQFAYFKTRICMRNALQDEMISSQSEDKEAVLITLNRPLIYIQPIALDKAVLVWLNYKNAYEYWNEQRASLNKEILTATQQVFEKVPQISQLSSQGLGTLFLQLTVDDMGICLPLNPYAGTTGNKMYDAEHEAAVVVTLESTRISACSCGSLVSKGRFTGLCIRFADEFETSNDDWKPDPADTNIMNLCIVSEGTYEICSRTVAPQGKNNAKWILNVQWQMEGVDIHLDTNVGKQLSSLFKALTALTSVEDECDTVEINDVCSIESKFHQSVQKPVMHRKGSTISENLPSVLLDPKLDPKKRSRLIEKEMNEQAKIINDLKLLGASQSTIEQEVRRLHELETAVFNDFRRDVIKKLRRQSVKATSFKDKLGLGSGARPLQSMSLFFPDADENNEISFSSSAYASNSNDSSPSHVHTRTGSLDMSDLPNIAISEKSVHRELSLDSIFTSNATSESIHPEQPSLDQADAACSNFLQELDESDCLGQEDQFPKKPVKKYLHFADFAEKFPKSENLTPGTGNYGVSSMKLPPSEPNIDFELDVKVFFNSGKCVLHTKEFSREDELSKRSLRKERSFSGVGFDLASPSHGKKRPGNGLKSNMSASRLRYVQNASVNQVADYTIFLIPGLDVKVHYNSKTVYGDSPLTSFSGSEKHSLGDMSLNSLSCRPNFQSADSSVISAAGLRRFGIKKACLFAWVTLQSIPEEAVVSPHILDFLEQALEPIPIQLTKHPHNLETNKIDEGATSLTTPSQYAYASFPVDVIVYFRMQPSILRFSCLPISRVECILRLPSVDLVFSSKRAENDLYSTASCESALPAKHRSWQFDCNAQSVFEAASVCQPAVGGLSMTGCLSDFSLYIFHPYGGGKKAGATREGEVSPLSATERKDSLSLQVEFVKVNISRSRKINLPYIDNITNWSKSSQTWDSGGALIRFSAVCDVGSASFKYDMRRLTEILAFPKAWYRRSIARRMFLGDQSSGTMYSDQEDSVETSSSSGTMSPNINKSEYAPFMNNVMGNSSVRNEASNEVSTSVQMPSNASYLSMNKVRPIGETFYSKNPRDRLWLNFDRPFKNSAMDSCSPSKSRSSSNDESKGSVSSDQSSPLHSGNLSSAWETLVLFAVNLSRLNVRMNMGNVMGNTTWLTRNFKSQGRLSIGSSGHKNLFLSLGLEGSTLDSKGGIVGGAIELSYIDTCLLLKEEVSQEPDHTVALKLRALESRLDYMGTSVLMGRVSCLDIVLKDEWRVSCASNKDPQVYNHPTKRPALIFVNGELSWDQLQLLISKSTTPDLIKMCSKLEEFFSQQFHSSKRVFSSLQPNFQRYSLRSSRIKKQKPSEESEAKHHRHWQKVLSMVSGLRINTMASALPNLGTILGGTMDLRGENISLACFHGINFRSKAWAIFSMKKPTISFATESQDVIKEDGSKATHIVQNLSYVLGSSSTETAQHSSMATVCRISRNVLFPPQFRSMHEWFHYAFATSELDDVEKFPIVDHEKENDRRISIPAKGPEFNHNMEVIFALPSMQLHLKTEHFQPSKLISAGAPKPTVNCSFVTEFDDHIFVAVDAEAFFFLHDLITSYIKEKETSAFGKSHSPDSDRKPKMTDPIEALQKDWRNYRCHTWHLEPTVRLLSWAGKGIEPYGVDYILQKLGFAHARVTIPKWMQRGCMDPLDKILAVVMEKMISCVKNDREDMVSKSCL